MQRRTDYFDGFALDSNWRSIRAIVIPTDEADGASLAQHSKARTTRIDARSQVENGLGNFFVQSSWAGPGG